MSAEPANHRQVVLGVAGGIAAFKACELLRLLTEDGFAVRVVPTAAALRFVGEATWAALSGQPVATEVWSDAHDVPHVRIGQRADLVVVAPATANVLAKAAHGLADDLLTNVLLTARCPIVYAPAMHSEMWQHPTTAANVELLRQRGAVVLTPAVGRLTGADSGPGRLPEPADIFTVCRRVLARGVDGLAADLTGRRVLVSAGGTREHLDPVRYLGNRSSGRQGYALAATAAARGAEVTLVAANAALPDPAGVKVVSVVSAEDMRVAVLAAAADADAVVMAAAVADFRPDSRVDRKIKKTAGQPAPVVLVANPDVLAELSSQRRPGQVLVGFAAETDDVLAHGRAKLARKGCDLMVVNQVGDGLAFEVPDNRATILGVDGSVTEVPYGPKEALADRVWDLVAARLPAPSSRAPPGGEGRRR
jgi:phosphopantothenoylcysteine decarboxylase / phosphopantothenate---cysteine ligase